MAPTVWLFPCALYENARDAQELLDRLKVIMEAVDQPPRILKELPENSNNLGYCSRSEKTISIKLRRDKKEFLPFPEVVATLCHELAHLETGYEHDRKFYEGVCFIAKLMDPTNNYGLITKIRKEIFNAVVDGDLKRAQSMLYTLFPIDNRKSSLWIHPESSDSVLDYCVHFGRVKVCELLVQRVYSIRLLKRAWLVAEAEKKKKCADVLAKRVEQLEGVSRESVYSSVYDKAAGTADGSAGVANGEERHELHIKSNDDLLLEEDTEDTQSKQSSEPRKMSRKAGEYAATFTDNLLDGAGASMMSLNGRELKFLSHQGGHPSRRKKIKAAQEQLKRAQTAEKSGRGSNDRSEKTKSTNLGRSTKGLQSIHNRVAHLLPPESSDASSEEETFQAAKQTVVQTSFPSENGSLGSKWKLANEFTVSNPTGAVEGTASTTESTGALQSFSGASTSTELGPTIVANAAATLVTSSVTSSVMASPSQMSGVISRVSQHLYQTRQRVDFGRTMGFFQKSTVNPNTITGHEIGSVQIGLSIGNNQMQHLCDASGKYFPSYYYQKMLNSGKKKKRKSEPDPMPGFDDVCSDPDAAFEESLEGDPKVDESLQEGLKVVPVDHLEDEDSNDPNAAGRSDPNGSGYNRDGPIANGESQELPRHEGVVSWEHLPGLVNPPGVSSISTPQELEDENTVVNNTGVLNSSNNVVINRSVTKPVQQAPVSPTSVVINNKLGVPIMSTKKQLSPVKTSGDLLAGIHSVAHEVLTVASPGILPPDHANYVGTMQVKDLSVNSMHKSIQHSKIKPGTSGTSSSNLGGMPTGMAPGGSTESSRILEIRCSFAKKTKASNRASRHTAEQKEAAGVEQIKTKKKRHMSSTLSNFHDYGKKDVELQVQVVNHNLGGAGNTSYGSFTTHGDFAKREKAKNKHSEVVNKWMKRMQRDGELADDPEVKKAIRAKLSATMRDFQAMIVKQKNARKEKGPDTVDNNFFTQNGAIGGDSRPGSRRNNLFARATDIEFNSGGASLKDFGRDNPNNFARNTTNDFSRMKLGSLERKFDGKRENRLSGKNTNNVFEESDSTTQFYSNLVQVARGINKHTRQARMTRLKMENSGGNSSSSSIFGGTSNHKGATPQPDALSAKLRPIGQVREACTKSAPDGSNIGLITMKSNGDLHYELKTDDVKQYVRELEAQERTNIQNEEVRKLLEPVIPVDLKIEEHHSPHSPTIHAWSEGSQLPALPLPKQRLDILASQISSQVNQKRLSLQHSTASSLKFLKDMSKTLKGIKRADTQGPQAGEAIKRDTSKNGDTSKKRNNSKTPRIASAH